MQFQVPQFIETEDRIVGPLTIKQFAYLAIAGVIIFMLFFILVTWLWIIISSIIGLIAAVFAFIKINGRPFIKIFISASKFVWGSKMYLWQREKPQKKELEIKTRKFKITSPTKEQRSFLKDLQLKLTTYSQAKPKKPARLETEKMKYDVWRKLTGDKEVARRVDYR